MHPPEHTAIGAAGRNRCRCLLEHREPFLSVGQARIVDDYPQRFEPLGVLPRPLFFISQGVFEMIHFEFARERGRDHVNVGEVLVAEVPRGYLRACKGQRVPRVAGSELSGD